MNSGLRSEIEAIVTDSLDRAEAVYDKVGIELEEALFSKTANVVVPTHIRGYPEIHKDKPCVGEFIALCLDMRDSSKHLNMACAEAKVEMLQRIFYEIAALLPASTKIVAHYNGGVTEYLGDGLLGFFPFSDPPAKKTFYDAYNASIQCVTAVQEIINPELKRRYKLPPIKIGIGLARSRAVITVSGEANFVKPIAFGKCVFDASKLSKKSENRVVINEALKITWPKEEGGKLRFQEKNWDGVKGYLLYEEED